LIRKGLSTNNPHMLKLLSLISGFILLTPLVVFSQNVLRNYVDLHGQKQGQWIILGENQEDSSYCSKCKVSEGHFLNDSKVGQWNYYNSKTGNLERIESFNPSVIQPIQEGSWIEDFHSKYDSIKTASDAQINQSVNGRKEGYWEVYGYMNPAKGYSDSCLIEKGIFHEGRKHGVWFKYFRTKCNSLRLVGTYEYGRPNGEYAKYFENGIVKEEGNYSGMRLKDEFKVYYDNGQLQQHVIFDEQGKEDSLKTYFHKDGSLHAIFDSKQSEDFIVLCRFGITNDSCDTKYVMKNAQNSKLTPCNSIVTTHCGHKAILKDSTDIRHLYRDRMGWSHTYNDCEEIEFEGVMNAGQPWTGKKYIYDDDCILEKIEIWEDGKFRTNGAL